MMAVKKQKLGLIEKLFVGLLVVVFAGIVVHAPLSVALGTLFPDFSVLIKAWKEILILLATVFSAIILVRKKQTNILKNPLILLMFAYGLLHIALLPLFWNGAASAIAGLMIDLRYILFFILVVVAVQLYPTLRRQFIAVITAGAIVVVVFALLQVFVLPPDILKYLGYNDTTIVPYLTVDLNADYVRINSTLRGPNPLGAYAGIVLALLLSFGFKGNHARFKKPIPVAVLIGIGGVVTLWASYSRSALVAAIVAIVIVIVVMFGRKLSKWIWIGAVVGCLALAGGLVAFRNTDFVSNVILHENIQDTNDVNSNDGHVSSLRDGVDRMVHQPFGGGVGSTGSASLYSDSPLIIENQYLFIAHEAGWLGLGLFLYINWMVLKKLWQKRTDWLALGVSASGIGLALIGLLLPVWVDDTVAIIWWGLAAIAIGGTYERTLNKTSKRTA